MLNVVWICDTGGDTIQFNYQAGSGPLGVSVETSHRLADNNWHSISVERNRYCTRVQCFLNI